MAKTEWSERTDNIKWFGVHIYCNPESESTLWSCDADVEFRLCSQTDNIEPYSRSFGQPFKFDFNCTNWGYPSFRKKSEVLDEKRGFIKDDKVLVEAHIQVKKTQGVWSSPAFDFTQPAAVADPSDYCTIVIDDTRLHVNKAYLSEYSPVFAAMFFGEFREKGMREVPIKDVNLKEFIEMLHVIYPSHKPITADNVEYLLKLADRFDVQRVIVECEAFLVRCGEEVSLATKLLCADQYALANLQAGGCR